MLRILSIINRSVAHTALIVQHNLISFRFSQPCERVVALAPHGVIRSIAWSPDERTLITGRGVLWTGGQGSPGPSLFVWDAASGRAQLQFGGDLFGVRGIALSPDGRTLLASGDARQDRRRMESAAGLTDESTYCHSSPVRESSAACRNSARRRQRFRAKWNPDTA